MQKKLKLLDLFSGAGGLSSGLEMAGFQPIGAIEINPQYAETYKLNHGLTDVFVGDVKAITKSDLRKRLGVASGEVSLVAGGPPCQGFSINAPIRSLDDQRNHLFKDFMNVVMELKPRAVLIENVPGMVSLGQGTVVQQIYKELESYGYCVNHKILFSGHYGVPQIRYRMFFVGILGSSEKFEFPEPEFKANGVANFTGAKELCINLGPLFEINLKKGTTVWDAISDIPEIEIPPGNSTYEYKTPPANEYQSVLRKNSISITNHHCAKLGNINLERLKYIPQGGSWRDIPFDLLPNGLKRAKRSDHTKRYGRLHPDGMCSTILTKCDPHWGSFFHPFQDRVISVREAGRIQSFPDHYVFTGSVTQQYEQVGNAVPPLMAKAIGKKIMSELGEINKP